MKWKMKAHTLAVLSRVPGGKRLYHSAQRWAGSNQLPADEGLSRSLEIVELIREAGKDPSGGTYLEIGTGWHPFLPFLLHLVGAERIITVDVNPWLSEAYAFETARAIGTQLGRVAHQLGLDPERIESRYRAAISNGNSLAELLGGFGVEYRCPADARTTGLPDGSVDFVCSSNVLEHISPDVLSDIHGESRRVLKTGGLAVHRFNPQDHYCRGDRSITGVNFLQYSPREWYWYGGSGLSYHNRLRCVEHRSLLGRAGFEIAVDRVRVDKRAQALIESKTIPIHEDFQRFTPSELAADYMWLVGRRA